MKLFFILELSQSAWIVYRYDNSLPFMAKISLWKYLKINNFFTMNCLFYAWSTKVMLISSYFIFPFFFFSNYLFPFWFTLQGTGSMYSIRLRWLQTSFEDSLNTACQRYCMALLFKLLASGWLNNIISLNKSSFRTQKPPHVKIEYKNILAPQSILFGSERMQNSDNNILMWIMLFCLPFLHRLYSNWMKSKWKHPRIGFSNISRKRNKKHF